MTERLVVIGGDAAGMSAASQARRRRPREQLEIVAFERGEHTSYSACGIPYLIGGVIPKAERLIARTPKRFAQLGVDARTSHEVTQIDLERRCVQVSAAGTQRWEPFDSLMIGTGATPRRPSLPGIATPGIFGVQTIGDGLAVRAWIDERSPRSAVIVGGGYIGLEMAEAFTARGITTSVIEMAPQPMVTLDPDMGALVAEAMRGMDIALYLGEGVTGFEQRDGRIAAVVTEARTLAADVVVLGLGVRPNADLAAAAGIQIGEHGGVLTDPRMRASAEGVWAGGDCVETRHRITGRMVSIALGTHANKQGRVAGTNITGGEARFGGVLGTAITKVCDLEIGRTGLLETEATDAGFDPVTMRVDSRSRAMYFPGAELVTVKVIADRATGRLLGAQIVGRENAGKRIDVFATALWNEMTVHDLQGVDLSYAPPFAPVWDPVLIAARKLSELLG